MNSSHRHSIAVSLWWLALDSAAGLDPLRAPSEVAAAPAFEGVVGIAVAPNLENKVGKAGFGTVADVAQSVANVVIPPQKGASQIRGLECQIGISCQRSLRSRARRASIA